MCSCENYNEEHLKFRKVGGRMYGDGFISLHRSILNWEWYDDINTKTVFLHLLLTVNFIDTQWHGIDIKRGQRMVSIAKLAEETGLTIKATRTAITHLISTNELSSKSPKKGQKKGIKTAEEKANHKNPQSTIFTVLQYDKYQDKGKPKGNPRADEGQRLNKDNKDNNIYIYIGKLSLSIEEYDKLVGWFGKANVDSKIEYAKNYKKLENYVSLYLTLLNWLRKDNPTVDTSGGVKKEKTELKFIEYDLFGKENNK